MTSIQRLNRSDDLRRLREDNYDVVFVNSHLAVRGVPYVTPEREIKRGTLVVAQLNMAGDVTGPPENHEMVWIGALPVRHDGSQLPLGAREVRVQISPDLVGEFRFSVKHVDPSHQYADYYEMFTTYYRYISGQAEVIDPSVGVRNLGPYVPETDESIFNYLDTATSRAGIPEATVKLEISAVAIVGLGGTGSYILDAIAKAPIRAIHLYDGDTFLTHNAFRSPAAPSLEELEQRPTKVAYFQSRYSRIHRGIVPHSTLIDESNVDALQGMDFVFLAIDSGSSRAMIMKHLESWGTPFADVGMGLKLTDDARIRGTLRVTSKLPGRDIDMSLYVDVSDDRDALYRRNIQTVDLNMLNAALAVIKFKKYLGFYYDDRGELQTGYAVAGNSLVNGVTP